MNRTIVAPLDSGAESRIERLRGLWAALPVSWTEEDELDEDAYRENVARICRAGLHGVYTHGTTGEFYAQREEEWRRVARATVEESRAAGVPCQVGCTALWTGEVIRRVEFAGQLGAFAVQIAFPFWMALSDSQAVRFFREVTCAVPEMPIVIYNTERSKKPLTTDLLGRIMDAGVPLVGLKGVGDAAEFAALSSAAPGVKIFVSEHLLAPLWKEGARGSYSAFVLACPGFMLRYYRLAEQESPEAMRIAAALARFLAEFVAPCVVRGLYDTALDRCIAATTGFLGGRILASRAPYDAAGECDVKLCREWLRRNLPEFLEEV